MTEANPYPAMRIMALEDCAASPEMRPAVVELITRSLPEFYEILSRCIPDLPAAVAGRLLQRGGELQNCHILCGEDPHPVGVFCCYPSESLALAQMTDLRALLRHAEKRRKALVQEELSATAGRMAPIPPDGCYLSRFAVAPAYHGKGIADILMQGFKAFAPAGAALYLHVNRDNSRAIAFYRRHGFDFIGAGPNYVYSAMACAPSTAQPAAHKDSGPGRPSETA